MINHNTLDVLLDRHCYDFLDKYSVRYQLLKLLSTPNDTLIPLTENEYQFIIEDTLYIINRNFQQTRDELIDELIEYKK